MAKDVHTEHCCIIHGCKYGDEDCTVTTRRQPQSYRCERCDWNGLDPTKADINTTIYNFKPGEYYQCSDKDSSTLLYIMAYQNNEAGETHLICDLHMPSDFLTTGKLDYISSVQGITKILRFQWKRINKTEFDELKAKYKKEFGSK